MHVMIVSCEGKFKKNLKNLMGGLSAFLKAQNKVFLKMGGVWFTLTRSDDHSSKPTIRATDQH